MANDNIKNIALLILGCVLLICSAIFYATGTSTILPTARENLSNTALASFVLGIIILAIYLVISTEGKVRKVILNIYIAISIIILFIVIVVGIVIPLISGPEYYIKNVCEPYHGSDCSVYSRCADAASNLYGSESTPAQNYQNSYQNCLTLPRSGMYP